MRRRTALLIAVLAGGFNLFAVASPAQASCHVIIEGGGCIENVICRPGELLGWECVD